MNCWEDSGVGVTHLYHSLLSFLKLLMNILQVFTFRINIPLTHMYTMKQIRTFHLSKPATLFE